MNKIFFATVSIVITVIASFAQTMSATKTTTDSDILAEAKLAIDKGNAQWAEAWEKNKPELVVELFAEDGKLLLSSGKVIKGHDQLLALYKNAMKGIGTDIKNIKVSVTTINAWLDGDMVFETGKYVYDYVENGKPVIEAGKYVTIWKKQKDGNWRLMMDMGVPKD